MFESSPHCCCPGPMDTGCFKHLLELGLQVYWDKTLTIALKGTRTSGVAELLSRLGASHKVARP